MNIEKAYKDLLKLKAELKKYPIGCIVTHHKNGHEYYGHQYVNKKTHKKKEKYIKLRDIKAEREKFKQRDDLRQQIKELEKLLKPHKKEILRIRAKWRQMHLAREKCKKLPHPENYRHYTLHGEYVISKSEALIADYLYMHHVEYEYSRELRLGNIPYYPDFTLFVDGCEIYVEHLGMEGDTGYSKKWKNKKIQYDNFGIIEGFNLICTHEDENGIDMQAIHEIFVSWGIVKR